jgi:hypothetical protein
MKLLAEEQVLAESPEDIAAVSTKGNSKKVAVKSRPKWVDDLRQG